jgi:hypothetical protein
MATRKRSAVPRDTAESHMRDQEVMRANRELAAYFKGRRTEREARAALKIIKAFIRDRERTDAAERRPLPNINRKLKAEAINGPVAIRSHGGVTDAGR